MKKAPDITTSRIISETPTYRKAVYAELIDEWLSTYDDFVTYSEKVKHNCAYVNDIDGVLTFSAFCLRDAQEKLDELEAAMNYKPKERPRYAL